MGKTAVKNKVVTFEQLKKAGIKVLTGKEFGLSKFITHRNVSLEEVRQILSKFKGSVAEEVAKMRDEV